MATISDVAKLAGMSVSTVSRVIDNKPHVTEEKRRKMQEAMKALGYSPLQAARQMRGSGSNNIAVVVAPTITNNFSGWFAGNSVRSNTLELLRLKSRDNARTPMQWSTEKNAGFSEAEPWIAVNDNYKTINAEASVKDPKSVFSYYKKLVQLRHEVPVITDGVYKLLDADNEKVYTYLRKNEDETLLVICNFTKETIVYSVGDFVEASQGTMFISNYDDAPQQYADAIELKPYGAYVYEIK